jgi:hypothetical protein
MQTTLDRMEMPQSCAKISYKASHLEDAFYGMEMSQSSDKISCKVTYLEDGFYWIILERFETIVLN